MVGDTHEVVEGCMRVGFVMCWECMLTMWFDMEIYAAHPVADGIS